MRLRGTDGGRPRGIGLAQLAMHSCYETAGAKDTEHLLRAARAFYGSGYRVSGESVAL